MPTYLVATQPHLTPDAAHRAQRGDNFCSPIGLLTATVRIDADNIGAAYAAASAQLIVDGHNPRIISIEETFTLDSRTLTDDELTEQLTSTDHIGDVDDYPDTDLSAHPDLMTYVTDVCDAIRDSAIIPGLAYSVISDEDSDYLMIEVSDQVTGAWRSAGTEARHLVDLGNPAGWPGILGIARNIIDHASSNHLL